MMPDCKCIRRRLTVCSTWRWRGTTVGVREEHHVSGAISRTTAPVLLVALLGLSAGCTVHRSYSTRTMPSPNGCYVQIWDRPEFGGNSDFINGPIRYQHLRDMPGQRSWTHRIRSLTLGPSAWAVAWSDERFAGRSLLLTADRGTFATLPVRIESLDIHCTTKTGG
jgi:hypothetical protein